MKKNLLIIFAITLLGLTGCFNLFESVDKPTGSDKTAAEKYEAEEAINGGDYSKAKEKADSVLQSEYKNITSIGAIKNDSDRKEYMKMQVIKGEAILGIAGAEAIPIINSSINAFSKNTTTRAVGGKIGVEEIIKLLEKLNSASDAEKVILFNQAVDAFTKGLPEDIGTELVKLKFTEEKDELRSYYLSAAVAYLLDAAINIKIIFFKNQNLDYLNIKESDKQDIATAKIKWKEPVFDTNMTNKVMITRAARILKDLTSAVECLDVFTGKISGLDDAKKKLKEQFVANATIILSKEELSIDDYNAFFAGF